MFRLNGHACILKHRKYIQRSLTTDSKHPGYWKDIQNQRAFFLELGTKLNFKSWDDWYQLTSVQLIENGGQQIWRIYNKSLTKIITTVFPEHQWNTTSFLNVHNPQNFWKNETNQRRFLDQLAEKKGYREWEDWYQVQRSDFVQQNGGIALLHYFDNSHIKLITNVLKEHPWVITKFKSVPRGHWSELKNHREHFDQIAVKFGIREWRDWYNITSQDLNRNKASVSLNYSNGGSLLETLQTVYPEHSWKSSEFTNHERSKDWWDRAYKKTQNRVFGLLCQIFKDVDILQNYYHPELNQKYSKVELDVFIPHYNIAFEYQGRQHYEETELFSSLKQNKERDQNKSKRCNEIGITLITLPYWLDVTSDNLKKTIREVRPDVVINQT